MNAIVIEPWKAEKMEFREASKPDELGPGWTVYGVITRQRVELASVSKSYLVPGGNYTTSTTDQESHVVSDLVYLMRRRVDDTIKELIEKAACFERKWSDAVKAESDARSAFQSESRKLNEQIATLTRDRDHFNELQKVAFDRLKEKEGLEAELAKLRDYLGKERYDAIMAVGRLEKMAETGVAEKTNG